MKRRVATLCIIVVFAVLGGCSPQAGVPEETISPPVQSVAGRVVTQEPPVVFESATETTFRPTQEPTVTEPRYGFTDDEIYLLTVLLCGDATIDGDGEYDIDFGNQNRYDQISLVLCVVMNRVRSEEYPDTVSDVVWQKGQFSPMRRYPDRVLPGVSAIGYQRVEEWCKAYDNWDVGVQSIPESHLYFTGNGVANTAK